MSDYTQAVEAIRRMAAMFQPMTDVANALEKIGSIEQAASEAELKRAVALREHESVMDQLHIAKDGIKEARTNAQTILDESRAEAARILAAAHDEAASIVAAANADAESLHRDASDKAAAQISQVGAQLATMQAKYDSMQSDLEAISAEVTKLSEARDTAKAQYEAIRAQVAKLIEV